MFSSHTDLVDIRNRKDAFLQSAIDRLAPNLDRLTQLKSLKYILAGFVAIALSNLAPAQTTIHIAGSTADRASVYQAIEDILKPGYTFGYAGSSLTKANQAIFTGTTTSGNYSVIFKTSFSGSVGGISILAANLTVGPGGSYTGGGGWLVDSTPQSTSGTAGAPANYDSPITADIASGDNYQASVPPNYQTPVLHDTKVGVLPFLFIATQGTPAQGSVTNITSKQVKSIFTLNGLPLSALSGNKADTETVLAVGRDEDSGTRVQALACSGIGVQTALTQYQPLFNGATTPVVPPPSPGTQITGAGQWPAVTLNALSYPQGDSGYSTGSSLAAAVNVSHSGSDPTYANWFVSYFGLSDAASVTTGITLDFNGVPYTAANVEGPGATGFTAQYKYWGYEHIFYRKTQTGVIKKVAGLLITDLTDSSAAVAGILLSDMHVHRVKDGGTILAGE